MAGGSEVENPEAIVALMPSVWKLYRRPIIVLSSVWNVSRISGPPGKKSGCVSPNLLTALCRLFIFSFRVLCSEKRDLAELKGWSSDAWTTI